MSKKERQMQKFLGNKPSKNKEAVDGKLFDYLGALKLAWYFETPTEKIILIVLSFLGLLKIKDLLGGWLF